MTSEASAIRNCVGGASIWAHRSGEVAIALEQLGYTVISVSTGSEGFSPVASFEASIDALVTDVAVRRAIDSR